MKSATKSTAKKAHNRAAKLTAKIADTVPAKLPAELAAAWARTAPDPAFAAFLTTLQQQALRDADMLRVAELKIQALTLELAHHKRIRFANKSEAFPVEQGQLFEESWHTDAAAIAAEGEQLIAPPCAATDPAAVVTALPRPRAGRQPLPAHLPRIEHRHEPLSCTCGQCGSALVQISEDVSEQLDVEPARFFVHRHIRPQYVCRPCEQVVAAAVPAAVIDAGLAAPGLLAWVVAQKFLDHLPLYRIEQISARQGVPIARSTLAEWVGRIGVALQPLADRLAEKLRERAVLHADETPVQQLDPGEGKTKRAYLWAYRSNDFDEFDGAGGVERSPPLIVFDYQPGRGGLHVQSFLAGWGGHLMVDDYAGYKALFRAPLGAGEGAPGGAAAPAPVIVELACLAHARRKFFELYAANQSPLAAEALVRIAGLYDVEQRGREMTIVDRQRLRLAEAKPQLAAWFEWLAATRRTTADGSGLARAIDYSLRRWPALVRYAERGDLPIDNNPIENAIRPIAIGKKNWLFAGSERAGKRAAAIQSLLGTAKLNGIEPMAWLAATLEKLPMWPNSRIDELLPIRGVVRR